MSEFVVNNHGECDDNCDNSGVHEGATYKLRSSYYFCKECHHRVAKIPEDKRY